MRRLAALCGTWYDLILGQKRCPACHAPFSPALARPECMRHNAKAEAKPSPRALLCPLCAACLHFAADERCPRCGGPAGPGAIDDAARSMQAASAASALPQPLALHTCLNCVHNPPPWQNLAFYAPYEGLLRDLILRFKFGQDFSLLPLLSHWLGQTCALLPHCHALIPMPRHHMRLFQRGFNQVHALCAPLVSTLDTPLCPNMLRRCRPTKPQAGLSGADRHSNPEGSFQAQMVQGLDVLLVDDIMTTGSTLRHAALALQQAGAASVQVAVLARVC